MSTLISNVNSPIQNIIVVDSDVNATAQNNISAAAGSVYQIEVDNPTNDILYLKLYDSVSVTVGTTAPVFIMPVPAKTTVNGFASASFTTGMAFATGISYCCTQETGTAGTSNPDSATTLRMVIS